jgi:lipase chaperone LimK
MEIDLKEKFKSIFKLMERYNLYFRDLKKLESFLYCNKIDFDKWWMSKDIYNLRKYISQNLSKPKSLNSMRRLSKIFQKLT